MNSNANYFKLGLFVVLATALLCGGIIFFGASKLFQPVFIVETYMSESVDGVSPGSAIKYRGINFGEVKAIELAARKYNPNFMEEGDFGSEVLLELAVRRSVLPPDSTDEKVAKWLKQAADAGLRARVASSGLTGPSYIEFIYLDPEYFPAEKLQWTPPELYIPSAPSSTQVLISTAQSILRELERINFDQIADNVDHLISSTQSAINDLNAKSIGENAVAFLEEIRESNRQLERILSNPNIDPSLADLRATLENAKNMTADIQEQLDDPAFKQFISNIENASNDFGPAITDIRRMIQRVDRLIASQRDGIERALMELNQVLENVKDVTEDASENPSRLLFGDPPPKIKPGGRP